jgi:nicotinamide phosphoribosyltransferase
MMSEVGLSHRKSVNTFDNPHFAKDAYKIQHIKQYPPGTEYVYSNQTPRSSSHFKYEGFNGKIVNVGQRGFAKKYLKQWWNRHFFDRPLHEVLQPYKDMVDSICGAGKVDVSHIEALHRLGYLPIRVKALPEGHLVNMRVPVATIMNTKPGFFWLTNFLETLWSNQSWKMITSATTAYEWNHLFQKHAIATGSPLWFVPYQGHDFSGRGMSGHVDSAESGFGHLCSFVGSDTIEAGDYACKIYGADWTKHVIMKAPAATEHAVMCANYALYGEEATYRRFLTEVYPEGMCAIVSDTWDYWNVIENVIPALKDIILARPGNAEGPGKLVLRPDSGNPYKILCGDNDWPVFSMSMAHDTSVSVGVMDEFIHREVFKYYSNFDTQAFYTSLLIDPMSCKYILRHPHTGEITYWEVTFPAGYYSDNPTAIAEARATGQDVWIPGSHGTAAEFVPTIVEKGSYQALWDIFGGSQTELGFRLLNEHIGVIYGEAINLELGDKILHRMRELGFASMNAVFGIGSFTYQYVTRDTFGIAVKATWCMVDGVGYDLQKHPATDDGTKTSAKGLMRVEYEEGNYVLYDEQTSEQEQEGALESIFIDGDLYNETTVIEIREHLHPTIDWPQVAQTI